MLWNDSSAAKRLVTNSRCPSVMTNGGRNPAARVKIRLMPSALACATMLSGPVATVIAQAQTP